MDFNDLLNGLRPLNSTHKKITSYHFHIKIWVIFVFLQNKAMTHYLQSCYTLHLYRLILFFYPVKLQHFEKNKLFKCIPPYNSKVILTLLLFALVHLSFPL